MRFLHWEINAAEGSVVRVELSAQANVLLLDDSNFRSFKSGRQYRYYGGWMRETPATLVVPHAGHWHVVVNLGGHAGRIEASVSVG